MKQLVLQMALLLMERKGKTSTLETKNALHDVFLSTGNRDDHSPIDPTFNLTQKECSQHMADLYVSENWERTLVGGQYYEYNLPPVVLQHAVINYPTQAIAAPVVQTQPIPQQTIPIVSKLDPANGEFVSYVKGKPEKYVQDIDRKVARKLCFQKYNPTEIGLTYDDIRQCSIKYYNDKLV